MSKCPFCNGELTKFFRNEHKTNNLKLYGDMIGLCQNCLCGITLTSKKAIT